MKRHLFIAAALTAGLALAGCDNAEDTESTAQAEAGTQAETATDAEQPISRSLEGVLAFAATDTPLPEDAEVTVSLRDVALADAPATVISESSVDAAGNEPVEFVLEYPADKVTAHHAHDLHAEIRDDEGNLRWTTPDRHPVEVGPEAEQGPVTLTLQPVETAAAIQEDLEEAEQEVLEAGEEAVEDGSDGEAQASTTP
ncbi:YbaY family lipoprotein [Halomonas organivorans]